MDFSINRDEAHQLLEQSRATSARPQQTQPPSRSFADTMYDEAKAVSDAAAERSTLLINRYRNTTSDQALMGLQMAGAAKQHLGVDVDPEVAMLDEGMVNQTVRKAMVMDRVKRNPALGRWASEGMVNASLYMEFGPDLNVLEAIIETGTYAFQRGTVGAWTQNRADRARNRLAAVQRIGEDADRTIEEIAYEETQRALQLGNEERAKIEERDEWGWVKTLRLLNEDRKESARIGNAQSIAINRKRTAERWEAEYGADSEVIRESMVRELQDRAEVLLRQDLQIDAEIEKRYTRPGSVQRFSRRLQDEPIWTAALADPQGFMDLALTTLLESGLPMAIGAATTLATRNPALGAAAMAGGVYEQSQQIAFDEVVKDMGYDLTNREDFARFLSDPDAARVLRDRKNAYAASIAAMEFVAGRAAAFQMVNNTAGELALQGLTQAAFGSGGEALALLLSGQDMDANEIILEGLVELLGTPVEVFGVGGQAVMNEARRRRSAAEAQGFFTSLAEGAAESGMRKKTPEKYAEVVAALTVDGPLEEISIDAETLNELFQSGKVDQQKFAEATGIPLEQLDGMLAEGSSVRIKTAQYAAKVAGTDMDTALRGDLRLGDVMTLNEMKASQEQQQALTAEVAQTAEDIKKGVSAIQNEVDTLIDDVSGRIMAGTGSVSEVARPIATNIVAAYATYAQRSNMSLADYVKRYPLPDFGSDIAAPSPKASDKLANLRAQPGADGDLIRSVAEAAGLPDTASPAELVTAMQDALVAGDSPDTSPEGVANRNRIRQLLLGDAAELNQSSVELFAQPLEFGPEGKRARVRDLAQAFTDWQRSLDGRALDPANSEEDFQAVVKGLLSEFREQQKSLNSGNGWYTADIEAAIETTKSIIPELEQPVMRDLFLTLAALLSPQERPGPNWENAILAMQSYLADGKISPIKPNGLNYGVSSHLTLPLLQHTIDTMGLDEAMVWMRTPHTGAEMAQVRKDSGIFSPKDRLSGDLPSELTLKDETLGIYMFGPKVGDFMLNSTGIDPTAVTVDLWAMRSYSRHTGRLMETTPKNAAAGGINDQPRGRKERDLVKRAFREVAAEVGEAPSTVQAALWYYEQRLWNEHGIRTENGNFKDAAKAAAARRDIRPDGPVLNQGPAAPRGVQGLQPVTEEDLRAGVTPDFLSRPGWATLTADRESLSTEENLARKEQLRADLDALGAPYREVTGRYGGEPENSFVTIIDRQDAITLGSRYQQDSILTNEGFVYTARPRATTRPTGRVLMGQDAVAQGFYSELDDGTTYAMEMDWDTGPGIAVIPEGFTTIPERPQLPIDDTGRAWLFHFTGKEGLQRVDPKMAGTGPLLAHDHKAGKERGFWGINPRADLRDAGTGYVKERGLGENVYLARVDPMKLYPYYADPDGLMTTEGRYGKLTKAQAKDQYEKAIQDAGYIGFYYEDDGSGAAPLGNVAVTFQPIEVKAIPDPNVDLSPQGTDYIFETDDSQSIPVADLINIRARPRGIANARVKMDGFTSRRKPLWRFPTTDGRSVVVDGNSTFAVLVERGIESVPMTEVKPDELDYQLRKAQDIKDVDQLLERAAAQEEAFNAALEAVGAEIDVITETKSKVPLKSRARLEQKIATKGSKAKGGRKPLGANVVTDVLRGGFVVNDTSQLDAIAEALAAKGYDVMNEGWATTDLGYFDAKIILRTSDGLLAEVQVWPEGMYDAKEFEGGHALYEAWFEATRARDFNIEKGNEEAAAEAAAKAEALRVESVEFYTARVPLLRDQSSSREARSDAASLNRSSETSEEKNRSSVQTLNVSSAESVVKFTPSSERSSSGASASSSNTAPYRQSMASYKKYLTFIMGRPPFDQSVLDGDGDSNTGIELNQSALIDTPAFDNWFDASVVRDANDEPMVVFHGTTAETDFEGFFPMSHFGTLQAAGDRAQQFRAWRDLPEVAERIMPVYVSIQNPLHMGKEHSWTTGSQWDTDADMFMQIADVLRRKGEEDSADVFDELSQDFEQALTQADPAVKLERMNALREEARAELELLGYDGMTYINVFEDAGSTSYIAFRPEQVKSVYNQGTFDPDDARMLAQRNRGSIVLPPASDPNRSPVINAFAGRDLSTLHHESGHLFMYLMERMVRDGVAPDSMIADYGVLRKWWKDNAKQVAEEGGTTQKAVTAYLRDGTTGDAATDLKVWTGMQEMFARGYERYLYEGKAPSKGLRELFNTFMSWMATVYKSIRDLNVPLNDDVRAVYDRILATDEQIAEARADAGDTRVLMAQSAEEMGMTEKQWEALLQLEREHMEEARSITRAEAMKPIKATFAEEYRAKRQAVQAEAEEEVNARPVYRVWEWLGNGRWLGDAQPAQLPDMRLDTALLNAEYPGAIERLPKGTRPFHVKDSGLSADEVAGFFGFTSGDAMLNALQSAPRRADAIRAAVKDRMRKEAPPEAREGDLAVAAADAIASESRGRIIAAELEALGKRASKRNPRTPASVLRDVARRQIEAMSVREATRTDSYRAAMTRAGEKAQMALAKGDFDAAYAAKREQLLNYGLFMESKKAAEMVSKLENRVARYRKKSTREAIAGEYWEAIVELLERYDFRKSTTQREGERREALNRYLEMMQAAGRENELAIPQHVIDKAQQRPYKTLTVNELTGVDTALRNIEHTGRRKQKLLDAANERNFDEAVATIVAGTENLRGTPRQRVEQPGDRRKNALKEFINLALNADTFLRRLDNFDIGDVYKLIKRPLDDAANAEMDMRTAAATKIDEIYGAYTRSEINHMAVKREHKALGGSFSKWDLISAVLNMGNADNLARLTDKDAGGFTPAQVEYIKAQLDPRDGQFVQNVWDHINEYWPLIEARERRQTGVAPKKVEASPVEMPFGILKGGYYPIQYDAGLSSKVADEQGNELTMNMMTGRFGKAQTKNGHTIERARTGGGRVLKLGMDVYHRHLSNVIHDLAFSEPVNNAWRLLQDPRVRGAFDAKGRGADRASLELWLQDTASGTLQGGGVVGRVALAAKNNFTVAKLAFNMSTVAIQLTGLTQSVAVVGAGNMAKGAMQVMANPVAMRASILENSAFMRERQTTFQRDINDLLGDVMRTPMDSNYHRALQTFAMAGFWTMQKVQFYGVDMFTWAGAYQERIQRNGGDKEDAVKYADRMVARAQASGLMPDRSAFERGTMSADTRQSGFIRLFTTLGSYMFSKGNIANEIHNRMMRDIKDENASTFAALLGALINYSLIFAVEAIAYNLIKGTLPGGEDDEDKGAEGFADDWALFIARETGMSMLSTVPFGRDLGSLLGGFSTGGAYGSMLEILVKPVEQIAQGELDAALWKSVSDVAGLAVGWPSSFVNRIIDGAYRMNDGEDVAPIEWIMGRRYVE